MQLLHYIHSTWTHGASQRPALIGVNQAESALGWPWWWGAVVVGGEPEEVVPACSVARPDGGLMMVVVSGTHCVHLLAVDVLVAEVLIAMHLAKSQRSR